MKPIIMFVFALLTLARLLSIAQESDAQNENASDRSGPVSAADMLSSYDCTRVGNLDSIYRVEYDIHLPTGNLLAAMVRVGDGYSSSLSVYFSADNGQLWYLTCNLPMDFYIHDVACAVYDDDFLVVYSQATGIKALRFSALNGNNMNFESGAQIVTVLPSAESTILELELESTQYHYYPIFYDYYLAALCTTNRVYIRKSDAVAEDWQIVDIPITNADHGLDFTLHEKSGNLALPHPMYVSFIEDDDEMSIYGLNGELNWDRLLYEVIGPTEPLFTALTAYGGHVYCFAEVNITDKSIRLYKSHNDGISWSQTDWYGGTDQEHSCPDITVRSGAGLAYTYRLWTSNPPFFSIEGQVAWGPIDLPYVYGLVTSSPSPYLYIKPNIELLSNGQYGVLYVKNTASEPQHAYFCKAGNCCHIGGDANNDGNCNIGDAVYINNFVFVPDNCDVSPPVGCPPKCISEGDANADGSVNIGDAVYLLNYVFKPGQCATNPPIGCPPECN